MSAAGLARARLEDAQCARRSRVLVDWLRKKGAPLVRMTETLLFLLSALPQSRFARRMNRGRGEQNGAGLWRGKA